MKEWKGEKREEEERQRREEGRENNPNYDVVYDEESKRDERAEIPESVGIPGLKPRDVGT